MHYMNGMAGRTGPANNFAIISSVKRVLITRLIFTWSAWGGGGEAGGSHLSGARSCPFVNPLDPGSR